MLWLHFSPIVIINCPIISWLNHDLILKIVLQMWNLRHLKDDFTYKPNQTWRQYGYIYNHKTRHFLIKYALSRIQVNTKCLVRCKTNLIYKTESLEMFCVPKYRTFFGPGFWFIGLRDLYTFCPEYNTNNQDDQNEDDQESLIRTFWIV